MIFNSRVVVSSLVTLPVVHVTETLCLMRECSRLQSLIDACNLVMQDKAESVYLYQHCPSMLDHKASSLPSEDHNVDLVNFLR